MNLKYALLTVILINAGLAYAGAPESHDNPYVSLAKTTVGILQNPSFSKDLEMHMQIAIKKYTNQLNAQQQEQAKELLDTAQSVNAIAAMPEKTEQQTEEKYKKWAALQSSAGQKINQFLEAVGQATGYTGPSDDPAQLKQLGKIYFDVVAQAIKANLKK